jgi:hypothetical protein
MRFSLRREPKGRHALGAAVTGIPSAPARPMPVPLPVDLTPTEVLPQPVQPAPLPPAPLHAVVAPAAPVEPAAVVAAVVVPPAPLPALPVQPLDLDLALLDLGGPVFPLPVTPPAPAVIPPVQAAPVEPPSVVVPVGPRVELGFADGTFRMLDPSSSAAQALSDLVAELTSKGDGFTASAS